MNINEILSSLSEDDINQLKTAAASLLGGDSGSSNNETNTSDENTSQQSSSETQAVSSNIPSIDTNLLKNIASVNSLMNNKDARLDLLVSLKPMLSEHRRTRVDEAVKILRLLNMFPALRDSGIF